MRPIPLNLLTLYADLSQGLPDDQEPASISRRRMSGKLRLYAIPPDKRQIYLGTAGDREAETKAALYRAAADRARARRKTITALKAAGVSAPDTTTGRVIKAMASAGLFDRGAVLVGTAAFQLYPMVIGAHLPGAALMTQDADIAVARVAVGHMVGVPSLQSILTTADPTFAPKLHRDHTHMFTFQSSSAFMVDVLTTPGRSEEPILVRGLDCGAQPHKFLDYLIEDPMVVVALVESGVRVTVPQPVRYALHKLIVAQRRGPLDPKAAKDVAQAQGIIEALRVRAPGMVEDAIDELRGRGPRWRKLIDRGLGLLET